MMQSFSSAPGNTMHSLRQTTPGIYRVRREIMKQSAVIAVVLAAAIWQAKFIFVTASADIYIFVLLFAAAIYGFYYTVSGTHRLHNEFIALEAMKELYADTLEAQRASRNGDSIKFRRSKSDAIVYHPPMVLATAHKLIVEEIHRNGYFRIPTSTMQVLVADLEGKLNDRQSMGHYLGALLVLLGLLGTFIGLMKVLASVGGILGSMDLSGAGGAAAIAGLIESLKKPLDGMATGFGASLFGLIGSLLVGLLSKLDMHASHRLKHDFEMWIRGVAQLGSTSGSAADAAQLGEQGGGGSASDVFKGRAILKAARLSIETTSRLAEQIGQLASGFERDHAERGLQSAILERLALHAERSTAMQVVLDDRIAGLAGSLVSMRQSLESATERVAAASELQMRTTANASASLQNAVEGGMLNMGRALSFMQNSLHEASERLGSAIELQNRLHTTSASTAQTDMHQLKEAVLQGVHRLHDVRETAGRMETSMAQSHHALLDGFGALASSPQLSPRAEVAAMIAELDHLIAESNLGARDIQNLRRLAALSEDPSGGNEARSNHAQPVGEHRLAANGRKTS